MLQNSNKKNDNETVLDKNLKMMSMSAIILLALFIYTLYKSSASINSTSYYVGVIFLFILLFFAIFLRFYKDKIKKFLPQNKFAQELQKASQKSSATTSVQENSEDSSIEAMTSEITFKDVAGISSVKEELEEIVDFLNAPKKYVKHGVKLPKGVLLVGPPGVGKTLVARAVAGEAKVPFFYQSGASFVHIYVGMGAKRVKELFAKAKASAPAIVFIDEIDAVGKKRSGSSNDEREATLNELLTQMDGFDGESGVIVIAATNKIEVLDDALLRAGRFDRRVFLNLPNIQDREKILELYLHKKKHDLDIKELAFNTAGFSSAAIATLINEALLNMIKRGDKVLLLEDIETAKTKVEFGKKEHKLLNSKQKEVLALYQASKAYIAQKPIRLFEEGIKKSDELFPSKSVLTQQIKEYLAGSIGVEVVQGEAYAIHTEDLHSAYELASVMVDEYKMEQDVQAFIEAVKSDLKSEIYKHTADVVRLKDILLHNEVITDNEL
ncbi:AAA family ATPase [Candidatus Marinarcus aquaticus]|uniref:Cell division protein FtsH n=1 Tax=Candidatus Marinarcus aquaticus TaxID=2044504 RepID=A0A4Q0XM31_9BACT|nr:AAA family ATPase [Candidatus Marinarcus aquaticus]RXJ54127.1 cell division protein FtsH [Candidatus Marinarcus aquaticus]